MEKVLVIIPENNKGKYITNGYSSAFERLNFFVYSKKIYDLKNEEILKISPDIIFCFWANSPANETVKEFLKETEIQKCNYIHISECNSEIPDEFKKNKNHYCFSFDENNNKYRIKPAIDSQAYKAQFNGYSHNITFVGNPSYKCREELLSKIIYNFGPISIFCRSFDFYKSLDDINKNGLLNEYYLELYRSSYKGYLENQKELSQIYTSSKINIDIENPNKNNINYRVLEALVSGGFLITQYDEETIKQFEDGKELETYKNDTELIDKINFYLNNLNIAQIIAFNGRKNATSNFDIYDRLKRILKVIYDKDFGN